MSYEAIIRDKLQKALGAMSQVDKSTPAAQFIEGIECAHSLGFHVVVYESDAGQLAVSLGRNEHQHWLKTSRYGPTWRVRLPEESPAINQLT